MRWRTDPADLLASALAACILAWLLVPTFAVAQTGTLPRPSAEVPACWPAAAGGTGSVHVAHANDFGVGYGWWCPDGTGGWTRKSIAWEHGHLWVMPASCGSVTTACLAALWRANAGAGSGEEPPSADVMLLHQHVLSLLEATRPATVRWLVAPNGSFTTRPAYRVDGLTLVTTGLRASVGAVCDLARARVDRSGVVYGAVPSIATAAVPAPVAVCRQE